MVKLIQAICISFIFYSSITFASDKPTLESSNKFRSMAEKELLIANKPSGDMILSESLRVHFDEVPRNQKKLRGKVLGLTYSPLFFSGNININSKDVLNLKSVGRLDTFGVAGGYQLGQSSSDETNTYVLGTISYGSKRLDLLSSTGYQYNNASIRLYRLSASLLRDTGFPVFSKTKTRYGVRADFSSLSQSADEESVRWGSQLASIAALVNANVRVNESVELGASLEYSFLKSNENLSPETLSFNLFLGAQL